MFAAVSVGIWRMGRPTDVLAGVALLGQHHEITCAGLHRCPNSLQQHWCHDDALRQCKKTVFSNMK